MGLTIANLKPSRSMSKELTKASVTRTGLSAAMNSSSVVAKRKLSWRLAAFFRGMAVGVCGREGTAIFIRLPTE